MKGAVQRTISIALRGGVAAFALALCIHGSTKRPSKISTRSAASAEITDDDIARGWRLVSVTTNAAVCYDRPEHGTRYRNWWLRGGYEDRFWLDPGGFRFPFGTNDWSRFSVSTWGEIRPVLRDRTRTIAATGCPMSAVPQRSEFWWSTESDGSRVLTWRNFALNRDANTPVNAQIVLFPNGDFVTRSNEVERTFVRVEPFDWDGDGIPNADDPHPRHNDGNHYGQTSERRAWIAERVGTNERNGFYRLRATFPANPPRRTLLTVGTNRVVVVAAGDYDFLLEKGGEYPISTEPFNAAVCYSADDGNGGVSAQTAAPPAVGQWTVSGGDLRLVSPTSAAPGRVLWMPTLTATPDLAHLGPGAPDHVFTAVLSDCPNPKSAAFAWDSTLGRSVFSNPFDITTRLDIADFPSWSDFTATLTATLGTNALTSTLHTTYGTAQTEPILSLSLTPETGAILLESPYENEPGVAVARHSSQMMLTLSCTAGSREASVEWNLDSCGAEIVVREDSPSGAVAALPWREKVERYGKAEKRLHVEAIRASGNEEDIRFTATASDGVETLVQVSKLTAVEILTETEEAWPENRRRHIVGPRERVRLFQQPARPVLAFEGDIGNRGSVGLEGTGYVLVAPDQPGKFDVLATALDAPLGLGFECLAPKSLQGENPRNLFPYEWDDLAVEPFADWEAGVLLHMDTYLRPQSVSFRHVRLFEGVALPTRRSGWYLDTRLFPDGQIGHGSSAGASADGGSDYAAVGDRNRTELGDYVGAWIGNMSSYSNGSYRVEIPLNWYTEGCSRTNSLPANIQEVAVFSNGTMRVSKNGIVWDRALNGSGHEVKEAKENEQ